MRTLLLVIATAATVLATVPVYAQQHIDCTVITRANFGVCTIQNSRTSTHDG